MLKMNAFLSEEPLLPYHEVLLEGIQLHQLSESLLYQFTDSSLVLEPSAYQQIRALALGVGEGVFGKDTDLDFPVVQVEQNTEGLRIGSYSKGEVGKLNGGEYLVLLALLKHVHFRIFFDVELRQKFLREKAKDYGLEQEDRLDDLLRLSYEEGELIVKPKQTAIIPVTERNLKEWSDWLGRDSFAGQQLSTEPHPDATFIVVIKRHKYYRHLMLDLYRAPRSKTGNIKNPLEALNPLEQVWTEEGQQQVKFFAALHKFQQPIAESQPEVDIEALRAVVLNPLNYSFYYHDELRSEKVNASSIVPVKLALLPKEVNLSIKKKSPFFELSGTIRLEETNYSLHSLNVQFSYFLQVDGVFYLVDHPKIWGLIRLFKDKTSAIWVHESKYPQFRSQVLTKLEDEINVHYQHVEAATTQQLAYFGAEVEKQIYLENLGNYVLLTPVMRYGEAEIPVRTKRQIHGEDEKGRLFLVKRDNPAETHFLSIIVRQHPFFEEQLLNELPYLYLHRKRFLDEDWFLEAFDAWFKEGVSIFGFNDLADNPLNPYKVQITIRILSGIDWFNVKADARYGKTRASLKQLYAAIRDRRKYVRLDDGTLGILPQEWIDKFSTYFNIGELLDEDTLGITKSNFSVIQELFEAEQLDEAVKQELYNYKQQLIEMELVKELPEPLGLQTKLRPYQRQGLAWLQFLDKLGFGGCLADDMGLGKTVQIIAFMLAQREAKGKLTDLLVVPTTLIFHWQEELNRFAPTLRVLVHHTGRVKDIQLFNEYDVILTTYGILVSDIPFMKDFVFHYVFLDESQQIKNPGSQRYKAARLLKARNRIAITGTPLENHVFDLYGQLSFACPGLLGSNKYFRDVYLTPIDQFHDKKRLAVLQQKVRPFILRRTKQAVAQELPEKTEMVWYCEMDSSQRKIYSAYEKEFRDYISATTNEELKKHSMHVLRGITRLRQICDSPVLLGEGRLPGNASIKIDSLMAEIAEKVPQHKLLVFSQFVAMLDLIKKELEKKKIGFTYLTGSTRNREKEVNRFRTDPGVNVFLISLKAGGTGLNLTEADYVYLMDPWWNPAVENQAIDRIHRIGQEKHVVAVRMVCKDTVEEKMMQIQEKKKALFETLIDQENPFQQQLSKEDLLELLGGI